MKKNQITIKDIEKELKLVSTLFRPEYHYILARKISPDEKISSGGIYLPTQNKDKISHTNKARIVALGEKAFDWKPKDQRPVLGDIVHFTRYEDFDIDHSSEYLEGEYCTIMDEFIVLTEIKKGE